MKEIDDILLSKFQTRSCEEIQDGLFFASKLVKMTGKQYAYTGAHHSKWTTSIQQIIGSAVGDRILDGFDCEMGAVTSFDDFKIAFSVDGFLSTEKANIFLEHKFFWKGELDAMKLRLALSQLTFYAALAQKSKYLRRSRFAQERLGVKELKLDMKKDCIGIVIITTPENIFCIEKNLTERKMDQAVTLYCKKAKAIQKAVMNRDWNDIKEWDTKYKRKEQDVLWKDIELDDFRQIISMPQYIKK